MVDVGRRAGKTVLGLNRCADPAVMCLPVGWFSPTYKMLIEVWREAVRMFSPITARRSVQDRRLELTTGGVLEFWSLDDPNVARGRKYRRVIIDEAAMITNLMDAWQYAIRPTLTDLSGDAWFLSTPRGRNAFWQMWQWGKDVAQPEWQSWQMPSSVNPNLAQSELDELQRTLSERAYRQEILAEFIEDGAGVFRWVRAAATASPQFARMMDHTYIFGVDWARSEDFTVIVVFDVTTQAVVALDRFNQIDYSIQVGRVQALAEKFKPLAIVAETNSIGVPVIEQLRRQGLPVVGFTTTSASKQIAIDALALAFERRQISLLPDETMIAELEAYSAERLAGGSIRYSAPSGLHDDTVMALAMAWHGASTNGSSFVMRYT